MDGRAIRDSLLRAAAVRGARRIRATARLDLAAGRVTGVRAGADRVGADAVVVAAGAWTAHVCEGAGRPLPIGPQRGQIVHARLPGADTGGWPVVLPGAGPYLLGFPAGRIVLGATREDVGFEHAATISGVGGLLAAVLQLAPGLAGAALLETRIGFRPVTGAGTPLLGPLAEGLFVAAGNGPQGLTASTRGPGAPPRRSRWASRRGPTSPRSIQPGSRPACRARADRQRPGAPGATRSGRAWETPGSRMGSQQRSSAGSTRWSR